MMTSRRPRVAAIGLDDSQLVSIAPLCGEMRPAGSLSGYLQNFSWTETDVVVSSALQSRSVNSSVNLMTIGTISFFWSDFARVSVPHHVSTHSGNTERELTVPQACPHSYKLLAAELSKQLALSGGPPAVMSTSRRDQSALIETTSGHPVALRLVLPDRSTSDDDALQRPVALLLPKVSNLAAWFSAFLYDVHKSDPGRVPHPPPRLAQPSIWYTPQEQDLTDQISKIEFDIGRLRDERDQLKANLAAEGEKADAGIRQVLWADGDDLVAAATEVLSDLGFEVRNMDAELSQGEPKREDLRLTLPDRPDWQALVEVKGYTSGTRTNDARQIREHRDLYTADEGRTPDLTVWLANPFRTMDPSARPALDPNVKDAAANVGAVYVLAADLYRQWVPVASGSLDEERVVQSLINAHPGIWTPPA